MPLLVQTWITRQDLKDNPDRIYVFGDNDKRVGVGGQAKEMRGEPNAVGVRTKKAPTYNPQDYYTDADLEENCRKIDEDMSILQEHLRQGKTVVWPEAGVGTGIANLHENAPDTLAHIQHWLRRLEVTPEYEDVNPTV